jgi:hypothetical protein
VSGRVSSIINDCKRTRRDEGLFKRIIFTETVALMKEAMDAALASLPDPISSTHVQSIVGTILRTAKDGERDPATLQRMALLELQIAQRD